MATYSDDLCTGGTASAKTEYSGTYPASKAFDDDTTQMAVWNSEGSWTSPEWLKYDFGVGVTHVVKKYSLLAYNNSDIPDGGVVEYAPSDWKFQGSNNDSDWTDLDTQADQDSWTPGTKKEYVFTNSTAYRYVRWLITGGISASYVLVKEAEVFEEESADNTGAGAVTLPKMLASITTQSIGGYVNLPTLACVASGFSVPLGGIGVSLPFFTISATSAIVGNGTITLTLPSVSAGMSQRATASMTMKSLTASAKTGERIYNTLKKFSAVGTAKVGAKGDGDVKLIRLSSIATVGYLGSGDGAITLKKFTGAATGSFVTVGSGAITLYSLASYAKGINVDRLTSDVLRYVRP